MLENLKDIYQTINEKTDGRLGILKKAVSSYTKTRGSADAASLAYYTIFSLFPLLLVVTAIGSFFLNSAAFYQYLTSIIQVTVPVSTELITENLDHLIEARGPVGLVGLLTLLWSASGMFTGLTNSISLAWPEKYRRNFVQTRLIGVGIVVGLTGLLVFSLSVIGILSVTPMLDKENGSTFTQGIWSAATTLGSWLSMIFLFWVLYRWIPSTDISWRPPLGGALFTTTAWKIAIWGFTWYLRSGLGQYQVVYGTLGAIVALLFLIFILANITLFGAHLSSAYDHWEDQRRSGRK